MDGKGVLLIFLHQPGSYVSVLSSKGGCELSPTPSRSLGTSSSQLESLMAHITRKTGAVGNRVCTGRE